MENVLTGGLERIELLGVPLDVVKEDNLEYAVLQMLDNGAVNQILLLDFRRFMRARGNSDFAQAVRRGALVLPVSRSLVWGARFVQKTAPLRVFPFDFVIRLLGILEKHGRSLYLLGSKMDELQRVENNLRASFPGLRFFGRCTGYFHKTMENDILLSIKKATPALLFTGPGIKGKETWIHLHRNHFSPGLFFWWEECFDIFSGKKDKPSRNLWKKGMDGFPLLLKKPWRIFRAFLYIWFFLSLVVERIKNR